MLNRIKIEGYKSIHDLDLGLGAVNLLIGSNGVGKTNFISFFKLVNNLYEQRLQQYSKQAGIDNMLYYGQKHTQEIKGQLSFAANTYSFTLKATEKNGLFISEEKNVYANRDDVYPQTNLQESNIRKSNYPRDVYLQEHLESYKIYHFHDTSKGAPLRTESNINDNRYLKTDGDNLAAFLYLLQQKYPKTLKRIELTIQSVMPYFERFTLEPSALDESKITLEWNETNHPEKYFDATDLSDGSIRFIALSTLLLQPKLPKVIIIDEPELGLHPTAIIKLAGMIKSAAERGCQMIISTQSADLINNFNAEDIITVDKKDNQSVFERLDPERLKNWLQDYSLGELWTKSIINGQPYSL